MRYVDMTFFLPTPSNRREEPDERPRSTEDRSDQMGC